DEDHAEQSVQDLPPAVRRGEHEELVDAGGDRHHAEEDRDRRDGRVVEAEHNDGEEEPEQPGEEEQPPGTSGALDRLPLLEVEHGHAASLAVVRSADARGPVGRPTEPDGAAPSGSARTCGVRYALSAFALRASNSACVIAPESRRPFAFSISPAAPPLLATVRT